MLIELCLAILKMVLSFLPGILLCYVLFPKSDIIERSAYSIILAASIFVIGRTLLGFLQINSMTIAFLTWAALILILILLLMKGKNYKTLYNKNIVWIVIFSIIGALWRQRFIKSIDNFGNAYAYSSIFIKGSVLDLGFYTGMALDHANYILTEMNEFFRFLIVKCTFLSLFLTVYIYVALIYRVFKTFRNRKLGLIASALLCIGPVEIFHSTITQNLPQISVSYISVFLLFLLYKSENKNLFGLFTLTFIACFTMLLTYYTASVVIVLLSIGFLIAISIKEILKNKSISKSMRNIFKNKKWKVFFFILVVSLIYLFIASNMKTYTINRVNNASIIQETIKTFLMTIENVTKTEITENGTIITRTISIRHFEPHFVLNPYKSPRFFGLSAIGWQSLFFLLCGATFIITIILKRAFSKENLDLLLSLIPVTLVSFGFYYVNLPTRIFDYFAFFGLLCLQIPKKYYKIFLIVSLAFIFLTGYQVAQDKKIFFENSDKLIEGAEWINSSLKGKVFSDQSFVNQLVLAGYYNVTGTSDNDIIVWNLFYQNNESLFLDTIFFLKQGLEADYIAITQKMEEDYILMLDIPQKPITNLELYEKNLKKVYDNGDVKVYYTYTNNKSCQN